MAERLPTVAGDNNAWGTILNGFLGVALNADGTLKLTAITGTLGYTPVNKAGDTGVGALGLGTNVLTAGGVALGTNPASAGSIRIGNNQWLSGRNAANSADVNLIKVGTTDKVSYGVRLTSDGYFSDTNRAVATSGDYSLISGYAQRLGGGIIGDTTIGFNCNLIDNALARTTTITGATNASPIVITAASHGYTNGTVVALGNVGGNTAANGKWVVANVTTNTFELQGSSGNGAWTSGGVVTSAGSLYGVSVSVQPNVTRVLSGVTGSATFGDDVVGVSVYNAGTVKGQAAFNVGGGVSGIDWSEGIGIDAACDIGLALTGISGSYGRGINMSGTYTTAGIEFSGATFSSQCIDFNTGTYSGGSLMRFKNDTYVTGRNAAGSADVNLFKINNINELQVASGSRFSGILVISNLLYMDEGKNMTAGTTTGTKLGTATNEKLAFHNSTPVIQRAGAAQAAVATTSATNTTPYGYTTQAQADAIVTLVNEIRATLVEKGLMKGAA